MCYTYGACALAHVNLAFQVENGRAGEAEGFQVSVKCNMAHIVVVVSASERANKSFIDHATVRPFVSDCVCVLFEGSKLAFKSVITMMIVIIIIIVQLKLTQKFIIIWLRSNCFCVTCCS